MRQALLLQNLPNYAILMSRFATLAKEIIDPLLRLHVDIDNTLLSPNSISVFAVHPVDLDLYNLEFIVSVLSIATGASLL